MFKTNYEGNFAHETVFVSTGHKVANRKESNRMGSIMQNLLASGNSDTVRRMKTMVKA